MRLMSGSKSAKKNKQIVWEQLINLEKYSSGLI